MIRNYITVAFRNLVKHQFFTLINVAGLTVGMTCCILVSLFVIDEFAYGSHHEKRDRIYRLLRKTERSDIPQSIGRSVTGGLADVLPERIPEVEAATRHMLRISWFHRDGERFRKWILVVDPSYFKIFTTPGLTGDSNELLAPGGAVLATREAAELFGIKTADGQAFHAEHDYVLGDYQLAGLVEGVPTRSDFRYDFLTTTVTTARDRHSVWSRWSPGNSSENQTFLLLAEDADPDVVEAKITELVRSELPSDHAERYTYMLQPLNRIHLYGQEDYGLRPTREQSDISVVRSLALVGVFVLLIACVNFTNLATSRSIVRSQEVGVRKVLGARRYQLAGQFLGESVLLSLISLCLALGLAELFLPEFNAFTNKTLSLRAETNLPLILGLVGIAGLVGLASGSYPAAFLSAFQPSVIVRSGSGSTGRGAVVRKALVVTQFALSIVLVISTAVVKGQLDYIRTKDLGFQRDQIVLMPIFRQDQLVKHSRTRLNARFETVKQAFQEHPNVIATSISGYIPGMVGSSKRFRIEDTREDNWRIFDLSVGPDFFATYDIEMVRGRAFSRELSDVDGGAYILNETAAKLFNIDPIGRAMSRDDGSRPGHVVGIVKDFHMKSLHEPVRPLVLWVRHDFIYWLAARIMPHNVEETLSFFEQQWNAFLPERPFGYQFLNDRYDEIYYQQEIRLSQMVSVASGLAIFVACLGLLGLAAFTTQQRTKEIGVRKVLGAPVLNVVRLLTGSFVGLVLIANLIAWPIAYFAMRTWLNDFVFHIDLTIVPFLLSGLSAVAIAFLTVSYQSIRASLMDPVEALRYE
jgi:putative ABC transport system permease protein